MAGPRHAQEALQGHIAGQGPSEPALPLLPHIAAGGAAVLVGTAGLNLGVAHPMHPHLHLQADLCLVEPSVTCDGRQ